MIFNPDHIKWCIACDHERIKIMTIAEVDFIFENESSK